MLALGSDFVEALSVVGVEFFSECRQHELCGLVPLGRLTLAGPLLLALGPTLTEPTSLHRMWD